MIDCMVNMRIVHINNTDLPGSRFNGHDMQIALNKMGFISHQFVYEKEGNNPNTIQIAPTSEERVLWHQYYKMEKKLSLNALFFPFARNIMIDDTFKTADIVHCHLIQNYFFSLYDLLKMSHMKPLVWTIHDPWALTGHCVHPIDCVNWKSGCVLCPHLDRYFPIEADNSSLMWDIKYSIYSTLKIDIVVASHWMENLIRESPLTKHFENVHMIPFGVNTEVFTCAYNQEKIRSQMGIPNDSFVIFFRAESSTYKGFDIILKTLSALKIKKHVTIITVGSAKLPLELLIKYKTIELGWVSNNNILAELYCACNVFLMPSIAEAFGMMAIEAMASGRPIIVMDGTSLPDVTFVPDCGISISRANAVHELKEGIEHLMQYPDECRKRGEIGRALAMKHYSFDIYLEKHIQLYESILSR